VFVLFVNFAAFKLVASSAASLSSGSLGLSSWPSADPTTYHLAKGTGAHPVALGVCEVAIGGTSGHRGAATAAVYDDPGLGGTRTASWMPDGAALQVHLFAVAERIAALRAAGTGRMEVVVVARLEHLAADEATAVGALHPESLLIALLAVGHRVLAHVLPVEHRLAGLAPEAGDVPLPVQGHQGLALLQQLPASGAVVRVVVLLQVRLVRDHPAVLLVGSGPRGTLRRWSWRGDASSDGLATGRNGSPRDAVLAEHLLTGVGNLWGNRVIVYIILSNYKNNGTS